MKANRGMRLPDGMKTLSDLSDFLNANDFEMRIFKVGTYRWECIFYKQERIDGEILKQMVTSAQGHNFLGALLNCYGKYMHPEKFNHGT